MCAWRSRRLGEDVAGGASARLRGVRATRGRSPRKPVAIVAVARKLAMLCWKLLITQREYAYQRPTLVARKMRALELTADEPGRRGRQGRAGNLGVAGASAAAVDLIASQLAEGAYRPSRATGKRHSRTPPRCTTDAGLDVPGLDAHCPRRDPPRRSPPTIGETAETTTSNDFTARLQQLRTDAASACELARELSADAAELIATAHQSASSRARPASADSPPTDLTFSVPESSESGGGVRHVR